MSKKTRKFKNVKKIRKFKNFKLYFSSIAEGICKTSVLLVLTSLGATGGEFAPRRLS